MSAEFTFVFVAMGQGDCCMVKCPDEQIVVVDCGSTANPWGDRSYVTEAQVQLRTWAKSQSNKIAALLLTHPDADHHNKVVDFFQETQYLANVTLPSSGVTLDKPKIARCDIEKIYFSNSAGDTSPLGNYTGGGLNGTVYNGYFNINAIHEVTINDADDNNNYYKTWNKVNGFKNLATTTKIANKRLTVLNGNTGGKDWSISVVAGNVSQGYGGAKDDATPDNAKSLITLFEVDGKKALLTGDATYSTEKFLYNIHKTLLTNLELAQVPHHGSSYASSDKFVNMVKPKAAVTSVGFLEHSYRLPRYEDVLDRWLDVIESKKCALADHDIDYWFGKSEETKKPLTYDEINKKYNKWTNDGKDFSRVGCNTSGTFWYLKDPVNGVYALYLLTEGGYFLFRETVTSNLCMTSQKNQVYTLSETGVTYKG